MSISLQRPNNLSNEAEVKKMLFSYHCDGFNKENSFGRVREPTQEAWKKLVRLMEFLHCTKQEIFTLNDDEKLEAQ